MQPVKQKIAIISEKQNLRRQSIRVIAAKFSVFKQSRISKLIVGRAFN